MHFTDRKEVIKNIIGLIVVCLIIFISFRYIDMDQIQNMIRDAGVWAPILFVLAKASTIVFAPLSGSPLYPLAGALFGLGHGFVYIVIGDALGATISFYISRLLGRTFVERFARSNMGAIDRTLSFIEKKKGFFIARVCFAALPEVVSYAAGLTRIKFIPFFVIHNAVGLIPSALLVWSGVLLATVSLHPTIVMAVIIAGAVVTIAGGWIFYRIAHTEKTTEEITQ